MPEADLNGLIVEQMADAMVHADVQGRIVGWNLAAEALFGIPRATAIGRSLDLIIPERLRAAHWAGFEQAMQRGATRLGRRALLTRALNGAGEAIHVEMSFAVLVDAQGRAVGSVAIARDATPHREELRALRERLAAAEAAGPDAA